MLLRNLGMKPSAADRDFLPTAKAGDPPAFEELTPRPALRTPARP